MKLVVSTSLFAVLAFWVAGCDSNPGFPLNENVVVQFDRSALGAAANLPISPTTGAINGAQTAIGGKLLEVSPEWILLESLTPHASGVMVERFWIPRSKILMITTRVDRGNGVAEQGAAGNH